MNIFQESDLVLILSKKNKWILRLKKGGVWSSHLGCIKHDSIIGLKPGERIKLKDREIIVTRPALVDFIDKMPRASQIIYPKDSAMIIFFGDVYPGLEVLELGIGSGALTLCLLRAVGKKGKVVSYDQDEGMIKKALKNIREFIPNPNLKVRIKNVYEGLDCEEKFDRIFIDIPRPEKVVPFLKDVIKEDGLVINYCLQADQLQRYVIGLKKEGFCQIESFETIKRDWLVDELRVRPKERIIGYGAFITIARASS